MTETREKKINNKVFTKNDIINLWHIFSSQHLSQKKDERTSPEMQVRCTDGTRYENKNEELLSQGNIFDIKKIEPINFEYRSFLIEYKRITIELTHGNSNYRNILTVKGDEGLWVAGTFNKFEILLNSVKPQNNWFVNYQTSILILSTFFLSNVLLKIITYLYPQYLGNLYPHSISILDYIVGIFFSCSGPKSNSMLGHNFITQLTKYIDNIDP